MGKNAFAAVNSTKFRVTNNTNGHLGDQYILVFLTPILNSPNYLYAAWQQLNPGDYATQPFDLSQDISATVSSVNGTESGSMAINPGYLSSATNPKGLSPVLGQPELSNKVTPQQAGVENLTNPFEPLVTSWSVNGNLVVQQSTPLSSGAVSLFELQTVLYWAVGNVVVGPTYTLSQITPLQSYSLPAGTPEVKVSVTYNTASGLYKFDFTPRSDALALDDEDLGRPPLKALPRGGPSTLNPNSTKGWPAGQLNTITISNPSAVDCPITVRVGTNPPQNYVVAAGGLQGFNVAGQAFKVTNAGTVALTITWTP